MRACIIYHTKTGHTREAAHYVARGLLDAGWTADVIAVAECDVTSLRDCDAVLVGSPCHAGASHIASGVARRIRRFLKRLPSDCLRGKTVGAFSVHCHVGGGRTVRSIERRLEALGGSVAVAGLAVKAGSFLSLWQGPDIAPGDARRLTALGMAVARAASGRDSGL
ncbi:MAG: flavodoxin domain-containing protein [Planctomycetes bacterium]|nr:flavodoxin domain-containing protein [Planctomycetota bacterium]